MQGKYIEIDNIDEILKRRCGQQAVQWATSKAGSLGINVVAKNVCNSSILGASNVVGAVLEKGTDSPSKCRRLFQKVGKPQAGILAINQPCQPSAYTSCTKGNQGGPDEYTDFNTKDCRPNTAGVRLAGTPVYTRAPGNYTPASLRPTSRGVSDAALALTINPTTGASFIPRRTTYIRNPRNTSYRASSLQKCRTSPLINLWGYLTRQEPKRLARACRTRVYQDYRLQHPIHTQTHDSST